MNHEDDPVDLLVMEYLAAQEVGDVPDLDALVQRLPTEEQRRELRSICLAANAAMAVFPELLKPQALIAGRYRLLELIGSGGYGKVWRARDEKIGRDVALKLFHSLREDSAILRDLQREQRALAGLHHDGIVRLLDSGKHEEAHFLAMELVEGRSLDHVLRTLVAAGVYPPTRECVERVIEPARAAESSRLDGEWFRTVALWVADVALALAAAHAHQPDRVVHRDLKPGNVLMRRGGRPVLVDFGLAGIGHSEGDVTGRLFGTVAYLAPEQIYRGKTGKDELTDLYQAGLLLYELLTLQRAFADDGRTKLLQSVAEGTFRKPRDVRRQIPRELEDICLRAMERDPARRYPSAVAMRDDLERWLDGQLPYASRLGSIGRAMRTGRHVVRRHRIAASLIAALYVVALSSWWLRPSTANLVARLGAAACVVEIDGHAGVMVWERRTGTDGELQVEPRRTQVGGRTAAMVHDLASGLHRLDFAPRLIDPDGGALIARAIHLNEVRDYEIVCAAAHTLARERERGLALREMVALAEELGTGARGGESIGPVDVESLFR